MRCPRELLLHHRWFQCGWTSYVQNAKNDDENISGYGRPIITIMGCCNTTQVADSEGIEGRVLAEVEAAEEDKVRETANSGDTNNETAEGPENEPLNPEPNDPEIDDENADENVDENVGSNQSEPEPSIEATPTEPEPEPGSIRNPTLMDNDSVGMDPEDVAADPNQQRDDIADDEPEIVYGTETANISPDGPRVDTEDYDKVGPLGLGTSLSRKGAGLLGVPSKLSLMDTASKMSEISHVSEPDFNAAVWVATHDESDMLPMPRNTMRGTPIAHEELLAEDDR